MWTTTQWQSISSPPSSRSSSPPWSPSLFSGFPSSAFLATPSKELGLVVAGMGLPLRVMELHPPITELPPPAMAPLPTATAAATSRSTSRALLIYSSRWPIFKGPPTTLLVKELRTQMESVTHHKRVPWWPDAKMTIVPQDLKISATKMSSCHTAPNGSWTTER